MTQPVRPKPLKDKIQDLKSATSGLQKQIQWRRENSTATQADMVAADYLSRVAFLLGKARQAYDRLTEE